MIMTGKTKVGKIVSSPQRAHKKIRAREAFSDNASDKIMHSSVPCAVEITEREGR